MHLVAEGEKEGCPRTPEHVNDGDVARVLDSDPRIAPFDLGFGAPVVLIHGFTSTPFEMRFIGSHLARHGFRAVGIRLPGHGLDPFALERATASDWVDAARAALFRLSQGRPVHLVGQSMGALISMLLAAEHPARVRSLALCAPAVRVTAMRSILLRLTRLRILTARLRFYDKGPSDLHDLLMRRRLPNIGRVPTAAAEQFARLQARARRVLPDITAPTVIIYSEKDGTVPAHVALESARRIGSRPVRMVRLERSSHIVTLDVERSRVATEIERFFRAVEG